MYYIFPINFSQSFIFSRASLAAKPMIPSEDASDSKLSIAQASSKYLTTSFKRSLSSFLDNEQLSNCRVISIMIGACSSYKVTPTTIK